MLPAHLTAATLRRFSNNSATRAERLAIVKHLLGGCRSCAKLAAEVFKLEIPHDAFEGYLHAIAPAHESSGPESDPCASMAERLLGWSQWAGLEPMSHEQRLLAVRSRPQLQHRGLYEELLKAAKLERREAPRRGVDIVRLALEVTHFLGAAPEQKQDLARLRSKALAELSIAHRMASDFDDSRVAIEEAWKEHGRSSGQPSDRATLLSIEASHLTQTRQWKLAIAKVEEALKISRQRCHGILEGHLLNQAGCIWTHLDLGRAIALSREAVRRTDSSDVRRSLSANGNLAWALSCANRPDEAMEVLNGSRHLYRQCNDGYFGPRLHWLEARILGTVGNLSAAARILSELWEEFSARNLYHEKDLVALDLFWIHTKQGPNDPGPLPTH
jgi:hypothetical protein